jgi:hypothetical protein
MKKLALAILLAVFLTATGLVVFFFVQNQIQKPIGGERDEHGCLIAAGFSWCEPKQKCIRTWEEICDEAANLLSVLVQNVEFILSSQEPTEFDWRLDPAQENWVTLKGQKTEAYRLSQAQFDTIDEFLKRYGFQIDQDNLAENPLGGVTGYQKGDLVCLVIYGATGYKEAEGEWEPPDPALKDVEIRCAYLL